MFLNSKYFEFKTTLKIQIQKFEIVDTSSDKMFDTVLAF